MLRLTLRTLLAYLDDTLEPAQAKDIGKKVAESDFAQRTVERIKTVTRRRRLVAPVFDADDHSADPNVIAEYLDNVLPGDEVTDLEQAALDSDVKLAEVAACHQILTLVLGEPATVPPTARRRMYRLVKGPESIPYRQPTANNAPVAGLTAPAEVDDFHEHDDDLLGTFLGPRKILWLVGLLLAVGLLIVAVWLAVPPAPPTPTQGYIAVLSPRTDTPKPVVPPVKKPEGSAVPKPDTPIPPTGSVDPVIGPPPREVGGGPGAGLPPVREPDAERRPVAVYDTPNQPLLFQRRDTPRWEPVARGAKDTLNVATADELLALPGFHPEFRLDTGVRLQLWGNVQAFVALPLSETRLTLHVPAQGLDADLTLRAGRVYVTAPKVGRPVTIRVRFHNEVWDVTLADGDTEVGIDLIGEPARGLFDRDLLPETPRALLYVGVLSGTAAIRTEFRGSGDLLGGAKWKWDSKGGRPGPAPKDDPDEAGVANRWSKVVPATPAGKDMAAAVTEIARWVGTGQGPFDLDFKNTIENQREAPGRRVLSAWMLAAMDSLGYLTEALEADAVPVRDAAAKALQHWVAQSPTRDVAFGQALGMKVTITESQRNLIGALVRVADRPAPAETMDQLFDLLGHDRLAIRELARLQLVRLDPVGAKESAYDAASDRRGMQATAWKTSWKRREVQGKG